jgi:hypothetical protein
MSEAPYRIQFDNARDPLTARNALGIDSVLAGYATTGNFPATPWTAYSPTISSSVGTITSSTVTTARYQKAGKTITVFFDVTVTNQGSGAGFLQISLPVAASASGGGAAFGRETTTPLAFTGSMLPGGTVMSLAGYNGASLVITNFHSIGIFIYESS